MIFERSGETMRLWERILIACLAVLCLGVPAAQAGSQGSVHEETHERVMKWLSPAEGDWYGLDGQLAMTIGDGAVDGCSVLAGYGFAGGYPRVGVFRIAEAAGSRDLQLAMIGDRGSAHQYLIVDKSNAFRRTAEPEYFESIGGLYLGITQEQVLALYGDPTKQDSRHTGFSTWEYKTEGLVINFEAQVATGITLRRGSPHRFDQSGLGPDDSGETWQEAYGLQRTPYVPKDKNSTSGAYPIGQGEYLFFSNEGVMLSLYNN